MSCEHSVLLVIMLPSWRLIALKQYAIKKRKRFTEMTAGAGCQGSWQCSRHIPHSRDRLLGSQGCRRCLLPCASFHRRLKKGKGKWVVEQRSNIASKHADIHFILVKTHILSNQKKIWGPVQMEGVLGVSLLITFPPVNYNTKLFSWYSLWASGWISTLE